MTSRTRWSQQSGYLQTTASCTAVSDLCGTTPYSRPTWTWEVGHNMWYAIQRQHVLCYEHKPEIKSLLSTRQSNPQTSRRNSIPRCNSFRRSQIKSTYQKHHQKAKSTLGFLTRNLKHCPKSCKKTVYLALVRSTLEYSAVVWDPHLQKDIDQLERVQRRSARFITGDYSFLD